MKIQCIACQGSGIGEGPERVQFGQLLPLCPRCDGAGVLTDRQAPDRPFRAIWCLSTRYVIRMAVPRRKGGFVELDIEWAPRMPPETGRGRLKPSERKAYEMGRDTALRALNLEMGGGDFSVVKAEERH
jgi:hypothetical protein